MERRAPTQRIRAARQPPTTAFLAPSMGTRKVGTLTFTITTTFSGPHRNHVGHAVAQVEHDLYADLRALDELHLDEIWIETPPADTAWDAVRDRVTRASMQE
jgi:Putative GTP-binding controlling metal-binding